MTLAEARAQCRVVPYGSPVAHDDDDLITRLIAVVTDELDGIDGWLNRALINRTLQYALDGFPPCSNRIYLPLTSPTTDDAATPISSVVYTDSNGDAQTLVEDTDFIVEKRNDPIYIEPVYGKSWPAIRAGTNAVTITYTAGYGAAASDIPEAIRSYMFVRLGQLHEFRELVVAGVTVAEVPFLRDSLENKRGRRPW
jgi:uncharacterized phiE125 gp8 family phage protein